MNAAWVYRVYDRDDRLIYIGCTADLDARMRQHYLGSWWGPDSARVTAEPFPDLGAARTAEAAAIRAEKPRWNLLGRGPRVAWSAKDYDDWLIAAERGGIDLSTCQRRTIERVRGERERMFDAAGNRRGAFAVELLAASSRQAS